jgi:DNA-binding response OmpR family regulator
MPGASDHQSSRIRLPDPRSQATPDEVLGRHTGQAQFFSAREAAVLELLMRRNGRVVPQRLIEDTLFSRSSDVVSNATEVYVHRVRKQLADANVRIHTVRGVGYILSENK